MLELLNIMIETQKEHVFLSLPPCSLPLRLQVSHHPPAAAHHAISDRGWTLRQEITVASKFRGKYLSIMPLGNPGYQ